MSLNFKEELVNTEMWKLFRNRFKSDTTEASYWSDIQEFCRITGKPFERCGKKDVKDYYEKMEDRVREGKLGSITLTKKFRELHSFAEFLMEEKGCFSGNEYDYFYPYLKSMTKESETAGYVPVKDMDALLKAASCDRMAYAILVLMYRAGISSTEIIAMRGEDDFLQYGDGVYAVLSERKVPCFIPNDAWEILDEYMKKRERFGTLFYNRNGRPLNTMYISRMMKKYCERAGIKRYSAQAVRNSCAFNLYAYGATDTETAEQMGRTVQQIRRYRGALYHADLLKNTAGLVKIHIDKP